MRNPRHRKKCQGKHWGVTKVLEVLGLPENVALAPGKRVSGGRTENI
jgi:hypothetical protein